MQQQQKQDEESAYMRRRKKEGVSGAEFKVNNACLLVWKCR